jgi:general secretion pathway protein I
MAERLRQLRTSIRQAGGRVPGRWRRAAVRAFTLLEVMVSLGILAVALMAIGDLNGGAVRMHAYASRLTVAVQLARGKMYDIKQQIVTDGLSDYSKEYHGDFSEEGWPEFKWTCKVIKPDFDIDSSKLLTQVAGGLGLNTTDIGSLSGQLGGLSSSIPGLSGAASGSSSGSSSSSSSGSTGGMLGALGPIGGLVDAQFKVISQQVKDEIRELKLTISWKSGSQTESFDVVEHDVFLPGTDAAGAATGATGATAGTGALGGTGSVQTGGPSTTPALPGQSNGPTSQGQQ